ncbi:MAG: YciI family protein [Patulibacter minatonensis]
MIVLRSTYTGTADEVGALRPAHLAWLDELIGGGVVIAAGRLADGSGAAVLGAGDDAEGLLRRFDADPYVSGGVATYEEVVTFPAAMGSDQIKHLDSRDDL